MQSILNDHNVIIIAITAYKSNDMIRQRANAVSDCE